MAEFKVGDRVKVIHGLYKGAVGSITNDFNSFAAVYLDKTPQPSLRRYVSFMKKYLSHYTDLPKCECGCE